MSQIRVPRRVERKRVKMAVGLLICPGAYQIPGYAFTLDFTHLGVGVETEANLAPGQVLDIVPAEGLKGAVRSRVVWVEPNEKGLSHKAGIEFVEPLGPAWEQQGAGRTPDGQ